MIVSEFKEDGFGGNVALTGVTADEPTSSFP